MIHAAITVVGTLLILLSLPGSLELGLLTVAGTLPARRRPRPGTTRGLSIRKLAIVIPAHDEALDVARTIHSLSLCTQPTDSSIAIVLIADNCSDDTAQVAERAGAHVIERFDETLRGKGFALQYGFGRLREESFEAFLVIDADTIVEPNLLTEVIGLLEAGADGVQTRYGVLNPEASIRTRLMNTALMAINVLRPRGRDRLGLSTGILGNGWAVTSATLAAVPYDAHSVVEDLEYGLRIVRSGRRIAFADRTTVRGLIPASGRGVETQRLRWEGGRLRMIRQNVPQLAREILGGRLALIEPLLDLLLLPLAFHVVLISGAAAIPFTPARIYALIAFVLLGFHVCASIVIGGGDWRDFTALLAAPVYALWKLKIAAKIFKAASFETPWIRTER
ncbi:MAG TPA: glycosyltransferase family 2 protein [Candidatus Binataceae bacterium]|nr:glycosyltransferase family 2 protein [Candidatus Binataceae bacterium]